MAAGVPSIMSACVSFSSLITPCVSSKIRYLVEEVDLHGLRRMSFGQVH